MTATFQTSSFAPLEANRNYRHNNRHCRLYYVEIENFEHEIESYEIEAYDAAEAAAEAESKAGCDIYNMNIYDMGY